MTISLFDLLLYSGAMFLLFVTPGPVWLALMARSMSGGFRAAWPLALGVVVGDVIWPLVAIVGVSWVVTEIDGFMTILRYGATLMFLFMGWNVIRNASATISENRELTRPGMIAGFLAGVAVILSNPKAVLFYMSVLPGFFDLTKITRPDIVAIVGVSIIVPLIGNLGLAIFIDRMRRILTSPTTLRRINLTAGWLLICVGLVIPFT